MTGTHPAPHRPHPAARAVLAIALLLLSVAALAAPPMLRASPAAVQDLAATGAHVSPRAMGETAPALQAELEDIVAAMRAERRPVSLAVVPGAVGTPTLRSYAVRLHRRADLDGTLIITTPDRRMAVAAPDEPPGVAQAALAASRAREFGNPLERLEAAARTAVAPRPEPSGAREVLTLLLLAVLGSAWAVAWGTQRTERQRRAHLTEARAHLRVWIDTLRSRAAIIIHSPGAGAPVRHRAREVEIRASDMLSALHSARTAEDVTGLHGGVAEALSELDTLAPAPVHPWREDPFAGLCHTDPAHGPATTGIAGPEGADGPGAERLCADCADAAAHGHTPALRQVPVGPDAAPYTIVAPPIAPAGVPK